MNDFQRYMIKTQIQIVMQQKNSEQRINRFTFNQIFTHRAETQRYSQDKYGQQSPKLIENRNSVLLHKFQQFFNGPKPGFFKELKGIFKNSVKVDKQDQGSHEYRIRGLTNKNRSISIAKKTSQKTPQTSPNLTIEQMNIKQIFRKAKLNKLTYLKEDFREKDERAALDQQIIKQGNRLMEQIRQELRKSRRKVSVITSPKKFMPELKMIKCEKKIMTCKLPFFSMLHYLNPTGKQKFTSADLIKSVLIFNKISLKMGSNVNYFNVYVEQGNNSQLIKATVRKRSGWRVVEIPQVANFIWTQIYRKSTLMKRPNRRQREQIIDQDSKSPRDRIQSEQKDRFAFQSGRDTQGSQDYFKSQLRKLVTLQESENISQMKKYQKQELKEISISHNILIHNHFPQHRCISDKKHLLNNLSNFYSRKNIDPFDHLPQSYEISNPQHEFLQEKRNMLTKTIQNDEQIWIIKPGESSNRGKGITVCHSLKQTLQKIDKYFENPEQKKQTKEGSIESQQIKVQPQQKVQAPKKLKKKCLILQKYIYPFLYNKRKFDIRAYMLVTLLNNKIRVYFYEECYIRTCSKLFDLNSTNKFIHLTNDAIQSQSNDYGKFEEGNKVAEAVFQKYINEEYCKNHCNNQKIWSKLKKQMSEKCVNIIESVEDKITSRCRHTGNDEELQSKKEIHYFELFGLDFMIDANFKLWLIEVNTNPSIVHDCSRALNRLIPKMLDNVFMIAVEPLMRPNRLLDANCDNQFVAVYSKDL